MSETYFKKTEDLSKRELLLIYDSFETKEYPVHYPAVDKKSCVLNILRLKDDYFENDPKFVFRELDTGEVEFLKSYGEPCDNQRFSKPHHKLSIEKILSIAEAKTLEEIIATQSDIDQSDVRVGSDTQSDTSDSQASADITIKPNTRAKRENIKPEPKVKSEPKQSKKKQAKTRYGGQKRESTREDLRKFGSNKARVKTPKYDSNLPIGAWIRNMEIYGRISALNDEELITCALSSLLSEEQGSHIIASLNDNELKEWTAFKEKLKDVLGFSRDHSKHLYENIQRGSDSFGVAMAKLQSYYRQGYNIKTLRAQDNVLLFEKFCAAQDDRLRELLLREKASLNVNTICKRANELERSFKRRELNFAAMT